MIKRRPTTRIDRMLAYRRRALKRLELPKRVPKQRHYVEEEK